MCDVSQEPEMRAIFVIIVSALLLGFGGVAGAASKAEQQAAIRKGAADTLAELYQDTQRHQVLQGR